MIVVVKIMNCKLIGYGVYDFFEMIMINNLIFDFKKKMLGFWYCYDWYIDVLSIR